MKITQLRNATIVIESGEKFILVDPMLAPKAAIPSLKYFTGNNRRNPLVAMPEGTDEILSRVTHCLITHCQKGHFDHLDKRGSKWLRENKIPVYCSDQDTDFLRKKGLDVRPLSSKTSNSFFSGSIDLVPCLHGKGIIGKFMAHGFGFFIQLKNEPSLYITGDTILTDTVKSFISDNQPSWIVLPAGGARFNLGGDIIMGKEEALQVATISKGRIIANHIEALDHCPVTRTELKTETAKRRLNGRFLVPEDGESIDLVKI